MQSGTPCAVPRFEIYLPTSVTLPSLPVHVLSQLFVILLLRVKLEVHDVTLVQCNLLVVANVDLFGALTVGRNQFRV